MATIRVADHSPSPGGRYIKDGDFSGEWFRNEFLVPSLREAVINNDTVTVELAGTSGYGSSFLEEAFGGLIRMRYFEPKVVRDRLRIVASSALYAPYKALADKYISTAKPSMAAA